MPSLSLGVWNWKAAAAADGRPDSIGDPSGETRIGFAFEEDEEDEKEEEVADAGERVSRLESIEDEDEDVCNCCSGCSGSSGGSGLGEESRAEGIGEGGGLTGSDEASRDQLCASERAGGRAGAAGAAQKASSAAAPSTAAKAKSRKDKKGADEEKKSDVPRFVDVCAAADRDCRQEMMDLFKAYDEAHPDRAKPGAGDAKADEKDSKQSSSRKPPPTKPRADAKRAAANAAPLVLPPAIEEHWSVQLIVPVGF